MSLSVLSAVATQVAIYAFCLEVATYTMLVPTMQGPPSESADSGSEANTPNTVYAREVAQLFVSGRHNQFRDSSRFGSLEGSRTLSSSRALQHAPTPSLPSNESIGEPSDVCAVIASQFKVRVCIMCLERALVSQARICLPTCALCLLG